MKYPNRNLFCPRKEFFGTTSWTQLKNRAQSFLLMAVLVNARDLCTIIDDWSKLIQIARFLRVHRSLIEAKATLIKAEVK